MNRYLLRVRDNSSEVQGVGYTRAAVQHRSSFGADLHDPYARSRNLHEIATISVKRRMRFAGPNTEKYSIRSGGSFSFFSNGVVR